MNEVIKELAYSQMKFWDAVQKATAQDAAITEEQYQSERRKHILQGLREKIRTKRIQLILVADWVGKSVDYCRQNITHRGNNNNIDSRWAVDVVVFLCREWAIALPIWCKDEQKRLGIAS